MGIFDFLSGSGEKSVTPPAAKPGVSKADIDKAMTDTLIKVLDKNGLEVENPRISFNAGTVAVSGKAANQATRESENLYHLEQVAYSPCKICSAFGEFPVWQLSADHVTLDQEEQTVSYDNAYFEFLDIPVLYTPILSHPSPGADNKSGFLAPSYSRINTLGNVGREGRRVDAN